MRGALILAMAVLFTRPALGESPHLKALGWRAGAFHTGQDNDFVQVELFAAWELVWKWKLRKDWNVESALELSAGGIRDTDREGLFVALGPALDFRRGNSPWSIDVGVRPTLISRHDFGPDDFGGPFQFTSHIGVGRDVGAYRIGYRFHHMSNARIYDENDGINFHFIQMSVRY